MKIKSWHIIRNYVAIILVALLISVTIIFAFSSSKYFGQSASLSTLILILASTSLFVAFIYILTRYLQTGFERRESGSLEDQLSDRPHASLELSELLLRLEHIEERLRAIDASSSKVSDSDMEELVGRLRRSIEESAKVEFLDEIRETIEENKTVDQLLKDVTGIYRATSIRLRIETEALTRRGTVNLIIGILMALAGMGILGLFVFERSSSEGIVGFAESFVPQLSLVVIVEILAYFFLRLYSKSLNEIKYFQNELTNVEARFLAIRVALHPNDDTPLSDVILNFSQTDRNSESQEEIRASGVKYSSVERERLASLMKEIFKVLSRNP